MSKKMVFLGTGGTIAGTASDASDNVGYRAAQIGVEGLLAAIPGLQSSLRDYVCEFEQVAQVDSKDMAWCHWRLLAQRVYHHLALADVAAVLITHGTDTLEETAFFLSQVLPAELLAAKPVVFVCAMRPASALAPDGPQNVLDAVTVAREPHARGVLVVCAGAIHSSRNVQKVHTYRPNAFDSGDAGVLGYVEEGTVRWVSGYLPDPNPGVQISMDRLADRAWPRVEIVMSHAGASGAMVRALCAAQEASPLRGIVVAGTGNGTIHHEMEVALQAAASAGVRVVRATRCAYGRVIAAHGMQGVFPDSRGLSAVKARVALMLELMA